MPSQADPQERGDLAALDAIQVRAAVSVPLLVGGRLVMNLNVHQDRPRTWTDEEVELIAEVAARTWASVERARAEEALAASEARFRGFAEASADTLWIVDATSGRPAYLSPSFAAMFGADGAAVRRDPGRWAALVHPDDRAAAATLLPQALAGEAATGEYRIVRPTDGATRWLRDSGFPARDAAGAVRYVGGVAQDITAEREAGEARERALATERAARSLAEATLRARDTFLAVAAHELRTPLAKIQLGASLLRGRPSLRAAERAHALAALETGADRLGLLVGDLVDMARLHSGQLRLTMAPLDLAAAAGRALADARARDVGGHPIALDAPEDLPRVLADAGRVEQVLANLLDNATKYSPDGEAVGVALRAEGAGVAVAVRDAGMGLPPGAAAAIFAPFARAANAEAAVLPGLGLGLAVAKGLVEAHGGWIRAESAGEGRGTTVTFWLPCAGPPGAAS